jgi:hypothetical protein
VLQQGAGPQLCFSTLDSYPPQCGGGVELQGWDWSEGTGDTTWANLDLVGGRVEVGVNVVDPDVQAALDRQYGEGAVVLYGHLEPVE